ncbi:MAG TPA: glycosyltransferase [Methanomicrobiales archaeon]|jgi:dolichol-phosphate mannosyltransferase|nr:glycosyltransferase [Methanomicrobiales archaeon]
MAVEAAGTPSGQEGGLVSVILATYNEKDILPEMIRKIHVYVRNPVEIIIVDDDSPDRTWEIAESLGDPSVHVIRRIRAKGLASALLRGILESRGDIICWWDADMLMCPELVPDMIRILGDCDIVIGSRYAPGGKDARGRARALTSRALNRLAQAVLDHGIRDFDSGFIVMRRRVFDRVLPIPFGFGEYFMEFMYTAARRGLSIREYPYVLTERTLGTSKGSPDPLRFLVTGVRYGVRIFVARFRAGG